MRHPALRRSARHSAKRDSRPESAQLVASPPADASHPAHDPASQNRTAPGAPADGDHNQGGVRQEGIEYQRDLGSEQDA
jgi:hypothetical protein